MKLKYLATATLVGTILFNSLPVYASTSEKINVTLENINFQVNGINPGSSENFSLPVLEYQGHIYVPAGLLGNHLGASVTWQEKSKLISFTLDKNQAENADLGDLKPVSVPKEVVAYNDSSVQYFFKGYVFQKSPVTINYQDHNYVPAAFIGSNLDFKVSWNGATRTVIFDSSNPVFSPTGYSFATNEQILKLCHLSYANLDDYISNANRKMTIKDILNSGAITNNPSLAKICNDIMSSYGNNNINSDLSDISDWKVIDTQNDVESSGFYGVAYQNTVTKEIVVAYRGTDNLYDGVYDLSAVTFADTNGVSEQLKPAEDLARRVINNNLGGFPVTITGHSLGGWLASKVTMDFNLLDNSWNNLVTFNAPGFWNPSKIDLVRSKLNDILTPVRYLDSNFFKLFMELQNSPFDANSYITQDEWNKNQNMGYARAKNFVISGDLVGDSPSVVVSTTAFEDLTMPGDAFMNHIGGVEPLGTNTADGLNNILNPDTIMDIKNRLSLHSITNFYNYLTDLHNFDNHTN